MPCPLSSAWIVKCRDRRSRPFPRWKPHAAGRLQGYEIWDWSSRPHVEGLRARDYAEEKGFEIAGGNPMNRRAAMAGRMTRAELEDRVTELETELDDVQEQLGEIEEERDQLQEQVDSIAEIVGGEEEAAQEEEASDSDLEADEPDDD
jgi:hypothetical protein